MKTKPDVNGRIKATTSSPKKPAQGGKGAIYSEWKESFLLTSDALVRDNPGVNSAGMTDMQV